MDENILIRGDSTRRQQCLETTTCKEKKDENQVLQPHGEVSMNVSIELPDDSGDGDDDVFDGKQQDHRESSANSASSHTIDKRLDEYKCLLTGEFAAQKKIWVESAGDRKFRHRLESEDKCSSTRDFDSPENNSNRLSVVAKNFFTRRRSHQNCLINTKNSEESPQLAPPEDIEQEKKKQRKASGIEALLRQSCSDVRALLVGDGSLFSSVGGGLSATGFFPRSRRQSTAALFQPGPRISPSPFESYNGAPFPRYAHLASCSQPHPSQSPALISLAPPSIICDGLLSIPTTPTNNQNLSYNPNTLTLASSSRSDYGSQQLPGGQHRRRSILLTPRSSFLVSVGNQASIDFRDSDLSVNYPNSYEETEGVSLIYIRLEKIPMKDFAAEIRAHLDVEHFLNQAQLMLDIQETNVDQILDSMLKHLLGQEESATAYIEARRVLFTRDSAHQLAKTIQCTCSSYCGGYDYDPSWICVLCTVSSVQRRHVAIARLKNAANFGRTSQEVLFIILVVTSTKEKGTKTALETGRTFATLFADFDLRLRLLSARSEQEFKQLMWEHMKDLAEEQQCIGQIRTRKSKDLTGLKSDPSESQVHSKCWLGGGLKEDWRRRAPHYLSDFTDGFCGTNTLHKTLSSTFFLYFACILPAIALGVLYYNNTSGPSGNGEIDVRKVIYSQTIAGLAFAIFGGQPMVILLTTAPLAIYTKVVFNICEDLHLDFRGMFACTGLWNSFFLLIYAVTDASKLMRWCTRSTEEIFALFISLALAVDAFKNVAYDFENNYNSPHCHQNISKLSLAFNKSFNESLSDVSECLRENSLLYLLLMLGTAWLSLSLYNFTKTPFLNAGKRELMADCALPVSVLVMSFFGSYLFRDVKLKKFKTIDDNLFTPPPLDKLGWPAIFGSMGLGFCLSLLFFMDHNIAGALVNSSDNRLKKGSAYHWDLLVIGIINAFLAFFGLPLVHGALPHSPLHVRAMADVEDRVYQGHVYLKIIYARETRVTGVCSHILIGLSLFYIEELKKIPKPVLDGLFLYLAVTALHGNQLFERILLLATEQAAYPPNHYIRTVPQRKVHLFTLLQLLQFAVLCGFGFSSIPYLKMVFPILHLVMLPIRHKLVPRLIDKRYLQSLDGH